MSLIEEALRRVQDIRPPASRTSAPRQTPLPPPVQQEHPQALQPTLRHRPSDDAAPVNPMLRGFAAKWIGLLAILGIVVGVSLWTYRFMETLRPVNVVLPTPPPAPIQLASESRLAPNTPTPPPQPVLKLTGVVEGVGEPFAIINEQIVRLGEDVDGAVLVAVEDNRARLRWKKSNEEVTLRTIR